MYLHNWNVIENTNHKGVPSEALEGNDERVLETGRKMILVIK